MNILIVVTHYFSFAINIPTGKSDILLVFAVFSVLYCSLDFFCTREVAV